MRHKKVAAVLASTALSMAAGVAAAAPLPAPQDVALSRRLAAIANDPAMPLPGQFSSGARFQERIADALYRGAIRGEILP
jgi:hypothetical protein